MHASRTCCFLTLAQFCNLQCQRVLECLAVPQRHWRQEPRMLTGQRWRALGSKASLTLHPQVMADLHTSMPVMPDI